MKRISFLLFLGAGVLTYAAQNEPNARGNNLAQQLIDEEAAKHPEVVIMAIHAKSSTDAAYPIIAWYGPTGGKVRMGKKADEDDMRVVNRGTENLEVNATGDRFEVEMPLKDVSGKTVGALAVVFPYKNGDNKTEMQRKAELIRDDMQPKISSAAKLSQAR